MTMIGPKIILAKQWRFDCYASSPRCAARCADAPFNGFLLPPDRLGGGVPPSAVITSSVRRPPTDSDRGRRQHGARSAPGPLRPRRRPDRSGPSRADPHTDAEPNGLAHRWPSPGTPPREPAASPSHPSASLPRTSRSCSHQAPGTEHLEDLSGSCALKSSPLMLTGLRRRQPLRAGGPLPALYCVKALLAPAPAASPGGSAAGAPAPCGGRSRPWPRPPRS